jgi:hypothetical protein
LEREQGNSSLHLEPIISTLKKMISLLTLEIHQRILNKWDLILS